MTTKYGFIYITTNNVSGKKYIGKRSYQKAGWEKYLGSGKLLLSAIKKYGRNSFSRQIVYESFDREDLEQAERLIIASFDAVNSKEFYNLSPGGSGTSYGFLGRKHSEDTKERMRQKALGHAVSDRTREISRENGLKSIQVLKEYRNKHGYGAGKDHARSIQVTLNGVAYNSITEARMAGYKFQDVKAFLRGEVSQISTGRKSRGLSRPVEICGVIYPSIAGAMRTLGKSRREIIRLSTTVSTYEVECLGDPQTSLTA